MAGKTNKSRAFRKPPPQALDTGLTPAANADLGGLIDERRPYANRHFGGFATLSQLDPKRQANQGELPPIIGLGTMGRAAEREKVFFFGICVEAKPFHLVHTSPSKPGGDVGFEIEPIVPCPALCEEALVFRCETGTEIFGHFITSLGNTGANRSRNPFCPGAQRFHRLHCRLNHPAMGTAPAGMRSADHPRLTVSQQDRRAIGGDDSNQRARAASDKRIGSGAMIVVPEFFHRRADRRMDLVNGHQWSIRQHGIAGPAAILHYGGGIVTRAEADIEPGYQAARNAAPAAQEAMLNALQYRGMVYLDGIDVSQGS